MAGLDASQLPHARGGRGAGRRRFVRATTARSRWHGPRPGGLAAARLAADPGARDATITTFQPATDTTYIPCISLIDAWAPDGRVQLVVYAHSLDLGKKAYANFVEIAALQREIAAGAGLPPGGLVIHVKTAHIYEPELDAMARLVEQTTAGALSPRDADIDGDPATRTRVG